MAWFDETVFYHIYPLGLCGAPLHNEYGEVVHRLNTLIPWIKHIKEIGCSGLYIGPLFESSGHGYETTDYRKMDTRLGTNDDLKEFVRLCHEEGIRVILDGVFNHTGRDFFAFKDLLEYRENSHFRDWYCNVNFWGNNEFNDGFSYDNWGGYNIMAKLNQRNPEVRDYLMDTIRFWVNEFDIDGLRLDAADVLDFDFMHALRQTAHEVKEDFWLMGEVIHGDYSRWVNERTLNSVTNYQLHKALYSAHNDHNYFEIAHTVRRHMQMGLGNEVKLYSFVDNHDVERIYTKLRDKAHYLPVHVLLYTLPGIPSIYYGSEYGIEGKKERYSDDSIRPCLDLNELEKIDNGCIELIKALGRIHANESALWYGDYEELQLTTTKYAFSRGDIIVTVNNDCNDTTFDLNIDGTYKGALSGRICTAENGHINLYLGGNGGEIWIRQGNEKRVYEPVKIKIENTAVNSEMKIPERTLNKAYEDMTVEELQAEILNKMANNGPVTDRMKQDVLENVYRDSLLNWVRSFR
ncbi:MAG: alpha-amylase [Erysipelotrichaceae bacterium]|nr:alpha-amylase [Erysipelotrichaceae bacterium]